jgi:glycine/D-amino acid oxidase-like deaminating enzyme
MCINNDHACGPQGVPTSVAAGTVDIPDAWEGLFAITPDSLPYIGSHRRYPGHWFALGYGGNGMTFGFLAARLLVEQWHGIHSPDHGLFGFQRTASR